MDYQSILAIVFVIFLSAFLYFKRKKIVVQKILYPVLYFAMYRTKLGLNWMDLIAKHFGKSIRLVSFFGVIVGFIGMLFMSYELVGNTIALFTSPDTAPSIKPVMPFAAKGVFFVPFIYWIISIFVIAIVHEFSHGMVARAFKIPVKSSGFAFLGIVLPIIPAAFVEPDEKQMSKRNAREQLSVFSAGPFSNIVMAGILFLLVLGVINPAAESMLQVNGVKVMSITKDGPFENAGIKEGELVKQIDNLQITTVENFTSYISKQPVGKELRITTNVTTRTIRSAQHPKDAKKSYLGVSIAQATQVKQEFKQKYSEAGTAFIVWFFGLIYWLLLLNLGIGLFNLLPIGPVDGGRMLLLVLQKWNPKKGMFVWKLISLFFMFIILANIITGFIR